MLCHHINLSFVKRGSCEHPFKYPLLLEGGNTEYQLYQTEITLIPKLDSYTLVINPKT